MGLKECTVSTRTYRKYHAGQVRFAMGCYGPFIEEYIAQFGRSQIQIVTLEEYKSDPQSTLQSIFQHLEVREPSQTEWEHILKRRKITNEQGSHYKGLKMRSDTRDMLQKAYAPCNENLATVTRDTRFLEWNKGKKAIRND
eukprot:m.225616 g.225616  ORF g.225616 m.225616 type:complete len:141 (+) comp15959_c1_seq6:2072-2494(+)